MPEPTWAVQGFSHDGTTAWEHLMQRVQERQCPISIYAHVPFCKTRCPFCDCHGTAMPRKSNDIVKRYVRRFQMEIEKWHSLPGLAQRPATTVHLGGGTPHSLKPLEFDTLVQALKSEFATDVQTEWAIETNSRCLDDKHIDQLAMLGFTRIHVGVQTLQPELRSVIGRLHAPDTVLAHIETCLSRGWIVSVDMLYGLPEQTSKQLLRDLDRLVHTGVHGISLYRLNHGTYNYKFMKQHGLIDRDTRRLYADYVMFMDAANLLTSAGYAKNHFTHFARENDRNLYSRHAARGEDLLSLGPTADGVFGNYYYRHGTLAEYLRGTPEHPAIQGGGYFTRAEQRAKTLVTQLMAGQIFDTGLDENALCFLKKLARADLLRRSASSRSWMLTDTGSWFIAECTAEAFRLYAHCEDEPFGRNA